MAAPVGGLLQGIFGRAGGAAAPAAVAPVAGVAQATVADLVANHTIAAWNADIVGFNANAVSRSVQADIQAVAVSTNTTQDTLFHISRSAFVYLPENVIADLASFCAPDWDSHLPAGAPVFNLATMQHGNSPISFQNQLWGPAFVDDETYATHSAAMLTRAISLAHGDSAVLSTLLDLAKAGQFPLGPFAMLPFVFNSLQKKNAVKRASKQEQ